MLGPVILTSSSTGGTAWASGTALRSSFDPVLQTDYQKYGGLTVASVVTTSGAGLTYNIEWSNDAPVAGSTITGSSQQTWFSSGSSALSSNAFISWAFPVRCMRVNVTTGTSLQAVTCTVIQSQS